MTLQHVTDDLAAKALSKPGITHSLSLKRGLRLALRWRNKHYTLSIARTGVYPSVGERAVLRRSFQIPDTRKWRTRRADQWHIWYIFWNPDNPDLPAPHVGPEHRAAGAAPIPTPARENTNPITSRPRAVGPAAALPAKPGGPT